MLRRGCASRRVSQCRSESISLRESMFLDVPATNTGHVRIPDGPEGSCELSRESSVQFDTLARRLELTRFPRVAPLGAARPQKRGGEGPTGRNDRGVRGSPGRRRRRAHCQLRVRAICFNCLVWRRTDALRAKISVRSSVRTCDGAAGRVWALSHLWRCSLVGEAVRAGSTSSRFWALPGHYTLRGLCCHVTWPRRRPM